MRGNLDDVQGDMRVFGSDGESIGMVGAIGWSETGNTSPGHPGPTVGFPRYLVVRRTPGGDLYVPEDEIASIEMGQGVALTVTADEALNRYADKPESMV